MKGLQRRTRILDLCTGTGALAIALKRMFPEANVSACDISRDALSLASDNARINDTDITFMQGDLFAPFCDAPPFDAVVCNPPYIASGDIPSLQREVQAEPILALDGGGDGLSILRRIAEDAPHHLNPSGALFLEIGVGQAESVRAMLATRFHEVTIEPDLQNIPRFVTAIKPKDK